MGVDSKHPLFSQFVEDWTQMRDTYRGERVVKEAGTKYLPPTRGMILDGMTDPNQIGYQDYTAYKKRAIYPDVVSEAVEALLGVMHHKAPTIELPAALEPMREKATTRNESLELLLRRINEEQLVTGRVGLLADVIDKGERRDQPYIALYKGEAVINWDEGRSDGIEVHNLNFISIDETGPERIDEFEWTEREKYRVLMLSEDESPESATEAASGEDGSSSVANLPGGTGVYRMGVYREDDSGTSFDPELLVTPQIRGRTLDVIPFVFCNTKDVVAEPDDPPLIGLSSLALAIYRGEADFRQSLHMQGQDTLVVIGQTSEEKETRVGAGAVIYLPLNGDAKYIGVSSEGLSEQSKALGDDYDRAMKKGGQLLDTVGTGQQSGEALRVRVAARTATLNQIALTGAFALQELLRIIARWVGANPEEVIVTPNLDFVDDRMTGKDLSELMGSKMLGAPISLETIHGRMEEQGLTKMTFEEELAAIEAEREQIEALAPPASQNPDGPDDGDPNEDPEDDTEDDAEDDTEDSEQ